MGSLKVLTFLNSTQQNYQLINCFNILIFISGFFCSILGNQIFIQKYEVNFMKSDNFVLQTLIFKYRVVEVIYNVTTSYFFMIFICVID